MTGDAETPIQRLLRLKQEALAAKPQPPRGGKFQRLQAESKAGGKRAPWRSK